MTMNAKSRSKHSPLPGAPEDIIPNDDITMSADEFMDMEFGPGTWVRDTWHDVYVTYDPHHTGPGIGYLVVDRQRRRSTTVVYPHQVH
jgi:hypothetical protein